MLLFGCINFIVYIIRNYSYIPLGKTGKYTSFPSYLSDPEAGIKLHSVYDPTNLFNYY